MKRLKFITGPRTALYAWCLASLAGGSYADAALLQVPTEYATIQAAVDAAASGDEIRLAPGVYTEQAFIQQKQLSLIGGPGVVIKAGHG